MTTILETERLFLRELTVEDADFILQLLNEPEYIIFIGDRGVRTHKDARNYIQETIIASYEKNGFGLYLVELKEDATPIGCCGLINRDGLPDIDIGYAFLAEFHNFGFATESAEAVMAFGKNNIGLKRIVGITAVDNQKSIKILEKVGLRFEKRITLPGDHEEILLFGWDA
ncbi:MAG: GNAT family N-acetyltransferase [Anaerolineae bacterium]|nr:GNAT family N-acetyltransferase [Anaerolineae bacterium]